jgi:hypothetical protein
MADDHRHQRAEEQALEERGCGGDAAGARPKRETNAAGRPP